MAFRNFPIRKKLTVIILLTTAAALLFTSASFFAYDILTFRRAAVTNLATMGQVIAANSTAALAFDNANDAREILSALRAERQITAAALYSDSGALFARYPATLEDVHLPAKPEAAGHQVDWWTLSSFQPVVQNGRQLGMLYLRYDLGAMRERFRVYGFLSLLVMGGSLLVALVFSQSLQQQVSRPILSLAETARAISERRDFSARAIKHGRDEIGLLTDAFNEMLSQIHAQDRALRESEARLRAVLNSSLSAVIVTDDRGRILVWNARAEKLFGRSRAEALGLDLGVILPPRDDLPDARGMKRFLPASEPGASESVVTEMMAYRRDRSEIIVEVSINPLVAGGVVTYCAFITDITDRKRAEAEVLTLTQQLERRVAERTVQLESANKELEAFSYSVSHDLRAPLRHIDGFASMLASHAKASLDDTGKRYIQVITDAAKRMGRLIDDLLSFSRHGRSELRFVPVKLGGLVDEVRRQMQSELSDRNIEWRIGPLPEVRVDVAMMHQVFANMIGNAVKYTRVRNPAVIEIGSETSDDGEVIVFVRDNGAGFNPKYKDRLFGVFQRLHSESEFEGTGVGLANVQRIIHRHGGRTWAEGEVDKGATFYFALPASARTDQLGSSATGRGIRDDEPVPTSRPPFQIK